MLTIRRWLPIATSLLAVLVGMAILYPRLEGQQESAAAEWNAATTAPRDYHIYTVEYKAKWNGKEKEVYRFDPGSLVVNRGEKIRLIFHGFHGKEHHLSIPAFHLKGTVKKGKETIFTLTPDQTGVFDILCHNHLTPEQNGPMIMQLAVIEP